MDRDLLTDCFYGHCLIRILHAIYTMRLTCPMLAILITKLDIDVTYRRLYVVAIMAIQTITVINKIAYILLRLQKDVANGPNHFSIVSETIMDIANGYSKK